MPPILDKIRYSESGSLLYLTVRREGDVGVRAHTYRVSPDRYRSLGEPPVGAPLDDAQLTALAEADEIVEATARALRLLSYGDNSANALLRKLRDRGVKREAAETAVATMLSRGYIREDEQLARLVTTYANAKLWGRRRILAALASKGYTPDAIRAAITRAEETGEIDFAALAEALIEDRLGQSPSREEKKKLLWKHGF